MMSAAPDPRIPPTPDSRLPAPELYACLYRPPFGDHPAAGEGHRANVVAAIAREFSPRFECHGPDLVAIDVSGLERLVGPPQTIAEELRREVAARGLRAHVAVAGTRTAAIVLAMSRPGVTVVARGGEADALAPVHIGILDIMAADEGAQSPLRSPGTPQSFARKGPAVPASAAVAALPSAVVAFKRWGLNTLGELAALPAADLASRMGRPALAWQALARGDDTRPLIPALDEERFDATLELEWPIKELEPLSFVLTRLLEPLSTRLERRDRGAAVLHVLLRLVTREVFARRLELPTPMRDVRTLRTLALLDLESHPPGAGVDRVTIVIDPTPGRIVQHTLFTRAHPTPEQLSTLVARLGALMGQDRFGAPAAVDSYRPGAFAMAPFATEHDEERRDRGARSERGSAASVEPQIQNPDDSRLPNPESRAVSALRRCRQPVPARVAVVDGRPVRVTTDRRGFAGGAVTQCAGPWRTSGAWWEERKLEVRRQKLEVRRQKLEVKGQKLEVKGQNLEIDSGGAGAWDRDEWDVSLSDGAVYRVFRDRETDGWFIDAVVD
jgi:protein ImuB